MKRLVIAAVFIGVLLTGCASPAATSGGDAAPAAPQSGDTAEGGAVDCADFVLTETEIDTAQFAAGYGFTPPEPDCLRVNDSRNNVTGVFYGAGQSIVDDFVAAGTAAGWVSAPSEQFPERTMLTRASSDLISIDLVPEGVKFATYMQTPLP